MNDTIDDKVKNAPIDFCEHDKVYIIGIEQEDLEFKGQYWYNCINCKTTGLDPLKNYKATNKLYDDQHIIYKRIEPEK